MSYASGLKTYLQSLPVEEGALQNAFDRGLSMETFPGDPKGKKPLRDKERALYLRGIFIASGTMADPKNQYYVAFSDKAAGLAGEDRKSVV